uniref:G-protein coupled receptors family 1 profile domain-containing protein n=1 Tax=Neogobius melanostomus TaxID=47308 RepID=A0A8C6THB4_9GOBI
MNNSSEICLPTAQHLSIPVLMCLVYFIGFLLNVFSLWVFCCRLPSWSTGTVLQFNLALSDALATPVTPLIATYFIMGNNWPFGQLLCQVKIALMTSHFYGSTFFLTLISVHRYMAVVHYNKSNKMKDKSFIKKLCTGVWLLLLAQSLVYSFVVPPTKVGNRAQCLSFSQKTLTNSLFVINFVLFFFGFLLPLSISAYCYFRITNALSRLNTSTHKGLKVKLKSQRMIRMCLIILGSASCHECNSDDGSGDNKVFSSTVPHSPSCPVRLLLLLDCGRTELLPGPAALCFGSQNFRDAFPSLKRDQTENMQGSESETTSAQPPCNGPYTLSLGH